MQTRAAHARLLTARRFTVRRFTVGRAAARHYGRSAGFTMVEILMVILIIGMLVTLLSVAIGFAIKKAKQTAIHIEISNLSAAMQDLSSKSLGGEFPPCMTIPAGSATPDRATQFSRMIRKRFPRCVQDYAAIKAFLQSSNAYNTAASNPNLYNLDLLDPAEAIVFWLGGLPAVPGATSSKLLGFSANATTPFVLTGSRGSSLYAFDESRLVDADGDGWLEYIPPGINKPSVAPYVYFDAASYQYSAGGNTYAACYPGTAFPITGGSPSAAFTNAWGFAVPYADTATPTAWSPKSFQLISAGLDSEYGGGPSDTAGSRPSLPLVPKSGTSAVPAILQGDWDNQVNFVDTVLEDQTGQ